MSTLRGTWYVVPTAFLPDGSLDLPSQRRLINAAVGWGVDGLTVLGVMSEVSTLSDEERGSVLQEIMAAADGRVPVAVGCSAATARQAAAYAREAGRLGAAAVMVSAPPLLKNVDLLPDFYARVAQEGGLPLLIQDEPAATGVNIPVSVLLSSVRSSGSRTIKLEDPPTPPKIARLLAAEPSLHVFGGLGGVSALGELRRGACGTMTGFAYPEILAAVRRAVEAGDLTSASRIFDRYLPLIQFEGQPVVGLSIRKEVLRRRGAIEAGAIRSSAPPLDPTTLEELDHLLNRLGIEPSLEPLEVS